MFSWKMLKELWAEMTAPCMEDEIEDYLEACAIVCGKCGFNDPEGNFCMMCPVKCSRDRILKEGN